MHGIVLSQYKVLLIDYGTIPLLLLLVGNRDLSIKQE